MKGWFTWVHSSRAQSVMEGGRGSRSLREDGDVVSAVRRQRQMNSAPAPRFSPLLVRQLEQVLPLQLTHSR